MPIIYVIRDRRTSLYISKNDRHSPRLSEAQVFAEEEVNRFLLGNARRYASSKVEVGAIWAPTAPH